MSILDNSQKLDTTEIPSTSHKSTRVQELEVLNSELQSLKKNAKVYKCQPNSSLFFLEDKQSVFSDAKKELDSLKKS